MFVRLFAIAYLLLGPLPASAALPQVPGYDGLPSRQKDLFDRIAAQEFCGCDSALTLSGCLKERPKCALAGSLGRVLLKASQSGASQSHVASFMSQAVVGPFCAPPVAIATGDAPRLGSKEARHEVIEFFDYRCAHCRQAMPYVHAGIKAAGKQAALTLVPVALMTNSPSSVAGEAALAADAQGKFWQMHEALFAQDESTYTPAGVAATAKRIGLNMAKFTAALASPAPAKRLAAYRERFLAMGLDGTPAMYINGRRFDLDPAVFDLASRLAMEAQRGDANCQ